MANYKGIKEILIKFKQLFSEERNKITNNLENNINTINNQITTINSKIPEESSDLNKLADKAFVNSSISTQTSNFRGNWDTWDNVPSTITLYPVDYTGSTTPTVNDYLIVRDYNGEGTWRFKYTGNWNDNGKLGWKQEYQVNEKPFTQSQLNSINSGITSTKIQETNNSLKDLDSRINNLALNTPVGTILCGLYTTAPEGFFLCNGAIYLKSKYPTLANLCKSVSDTQFQVPDLRNRFLQGALLSSNVNTYIEPGLPNITGGHTSAHIPSSAAGALFAYGTGYTLSVTGAGAYGAVNFDASKGETKTDGTLKTEKEAHVYGNSDTVQPPAYTVNYIIKY